MRLILCGYASCGKSTLARAYAKRYGVGYIDTDDAVLASAAAQGQRCSSISALCSALGQGAFHTMEAEVVSSIQHSNAGVIATGGGVLQHTPSAQALAACGRLVYLKVAPHLLKQRLLMRSPVPTFLGEAPEDTVDAYLSSRDALYLHWADHVIELGEASIDQWVERLYDIGVQDGK